MNPLILLALLLPLAAGAQVRKCTIDGQIVYSDSRCGQAGAAVNTDANSLDTSGLRDLAKQQRQREAAEKAKMAAANTRPKGGSAGPCDHIKFAGAAPTSEEAQRRKDCMLKAAKDFRR
ncbi:MAG: hypothetical protein KDH93_25365 [Rhodoferax sp.]|nr:hypothetical protein [Rhodoferax sp.]